MAGSHYRPRFKLRTLLGMTLLFASLLGWASYRRQAQYRAVQTLRENGAIALEENRVIGKETFTFTGNTRMTMMLPTLSVTNSEDGTLRRLVPDKFWTRYSVLMIQAPMKIGIGELEAHIRHMPWLEDVYISGSALDKTTVAALRTKFPKIEFRINLVPVSLPIQQRNGMHSLLWFKKTWSPRGFH